MGPLRRWIHKVLHGKPKPTPTPTPPPKPTATLVVGNPPQEIPVKVTRRPDADPDRLPPAGQ